MTRSPSTDGSACKSFGVIRSCLLGYFFTAPRRRIRCQRFQETPGDTRDFIHSSIECRLIDLGRLVKSTDLSDELQRRSLHFFRGHRRIKVEECLDISAHVLDSLTPPTTPSLLRETRVSRTRCHLARTRGWLIPAFCRHQPDRLRETHGSQCLRELLPCYSPVLRDGVVCTPALVVLNRDVQVQRVLSRFSPIPDLVDDSSTSSISKECGFLHPWPLHQERVIISNARDDAKRVCLNGKSRPPL